MATRKIIIAAAILAACATPAAAQYRPGAPAVQYREDMPAVNAAPPSANPDAGNYAASSAFARWYQAAGRPSMLLFWNRQLLEDAGNYQASSAFARWYQAAGRPSMLLFWNRQLLEDATSQYDSVQTGRIDSVAGAESATIRGWRGSASAAVVGSSTVAETRQYQERMTDGSYGFRNTNFTRGVESSILSTFISAGARIVDREAVMRKVSATKSREDRMDIQYLETLAMGQGIQYLIEILPDDDAGSPTGVTFTVKVTHLPTSTVRAQFATSGDPPRGEAKWTAVNGAGFEKRAAASRQTPQLIGAQVAYDTMTKLR